MLRRPILLTFLFMVFVFGKSPGQAQSRGTVDLEARTQADQIWNSKLRKCGDSFYWMNSPKAGELHEAKSVSILVRPDQLSEADRLNGVQWKGTTVLTLTTFRTYRNSTWTRWEEWPTGGSIPYFAVEVRVQKAKGRWDHSENMGGGSLFTNMYPVSCSDASNPAAFTTGNVRRAATEAYNAELTRALQDAPNKGIFVSSNPKPSANMFRFVYSARSYSNLGSYFFLPDGGWWVLNSEGRIVWDRGYNGNGMMFDRLPADLQGELERVTHTSNVVFVTIRRAAFSWNNNWIVLYDHNGPAIASHNVPENLVSEIRSRFDSRDITIDSIALNPSGGWILKYSENEAKNEIFSGYRWRAHYLWRDLSPELEKGLQRLIDSKETIRQVEFSPPDGWVVLYGRNGYLSSHVGEELSDMLRRLQGAGLEIQRIAIGQNSEWIVTAGR